MINFVKNINHKRIIKKNIFTFIVIIILISCVEPLTDSTQSVAPTIEIIKPVTGDSVMIGKNEVEYKAVDGTGGQGLSFYEVYINNKFTKKYLQNDDGTNPKIYLEIDSTLLGSTIKYFIKVYNKAGKAKESKVQENIYVKDKPPAAPSNLIIKKTSDYSVTLLWNDNSNNEKGFEIWRKDGGGGTYRKIKNLPANTISTIDDGISPFVDYFYKVRAYNDSGPSDFSNEVGTSSLPGGQWNLQAEAIGASLIILKWNDFAVNELGFKIERTNPYTNNWEVIDITAPNQTEYEDSNVQPSTAYKYRVAYFTSNSISGYSNEASISTFYTDVDGPTNLLGYYSSGVVLQWTNNDKLQITKGTIIERKTGTDGKFTEISTIDSDATSFNDVNVQSGKTYYYRVRQKLASRIYTPYSNTIFITIP
ncbi:MAG: fibronectin type III domain-containing protein [Melioribacter sp.]|uniref:fibronectin type III domain-containing protein n=1 Tax=Rosettibacter primus TaxID=3111523 RepID=UPI00247EE667|nr:fibronectin type III domain-containing protein [Melioribacter sp.]